MGNARNLGSFLGTNTSLSTINNAYAAGTLVPSSTNPNMVINGAMEINQRGNQTGLTTGGYMLDRHHLQITSMGTLSVTQDTEVPSGQGLFKSMKIQCTATGTYNSGNSNLVVIHRIEGFDSVQTMFGTSDAKDVTLSFWIKANRAQTLTVNFENEQTSGGNSDQGYQTSQAYTTADTWQKMVVTVPGDTRSGMGFNFNSSKALCFDISLSTGYTSGDTPSATWSNLANGQRHGHNTEYFGDSTANYFNITGVKLELGSEATDFQHVTYEEELTKCKRYYQVYGGSGNYHAFAAVGTYNTSSGVGYLDLEVTMRAQPTSSTVGTFQASNGVVSTCGVNLSSFAEPDGGCKLIQVHAHSASGFINGYFMRVRADNNATTRLKFDAEL
jgi:hypothetical protein